MDVSNAGDGPPGARLAALPYAAGWLAAVAVVVFCLWFLTLDVRHLLRSDEGRYAEIAREMLATGDWVTVRYNGLKYFEKPPFHMWATALAYRAFGIGEWQARLWVAISGAGGMVMTMLAAQRWFGRRVGLLTGLVLLATPFWVLGGHFNSLDMSVSGALACVLAGFLIAQHPGAASQTRRAWMWFAWAAMAVAILTKGLIGVALPGLVLIVYTLLARDWALWRRLHVVSGALLMLAIAAPWFVLVSVRNPEFPQFFFIHEHWQRYTSTIHQRAAPFWYFVPLLLVGFLPWLGLSLRIRGLARDEPRTGGFRPILLLAVWAGAIFVFFSLSSSKLPGYIMPIFPALAVLGALALGNVDTRAWSRQIIGVALLVLIGLVAMALLGLSGSAGTASASMRDFERWIAGAFVVALCGFAVAAYLNRAGAVFDSIVAYSLTVFVATTVGMLAHETLGRGVSGIDLVVPVRAVLTPEMPIYSVRLLDHTLPFYLQRTMIMVEGPDELEFGTRQEPEKWMPTVPAFLKEWSSGRRALAIMSPATYAALRQDGVSMNKVAADERRVVVANFPVASP